VRAKKAPQLFLLGPPLPGRLPLENSEGCQLSLGLEHSFHGGRTEAADELVLQVFDAHEEAQPLHIPSAENGAKSGPLETALKVPLFCGVTEARQPKVTSLRAVAIDEASDVLRAPHRHDDDALSAKISATTPCERFERALVAYSFDKDNRSCRGKLRRPHAHEVIESNSAV